MAGAYGMRGMTPPPGGGGIGALDPRMILQLIQQIFSPRPGTPMGLALNKPAPGFGVRGPGGQGLPSPAGGAPQDMLVQLAQQLFGQGNSLRGMVEGGPSVDGTPLVKRPPLGSVPPAAGPPVASNPAVSPGEPDIGALLDAFAPMAPGAVTEAAAAPIAEAPPGAGMDAAVPGVIRPSDESVEASPDAEDVPADMTQDDMAAVDTVDDTGEMAPDTAPRTMSSPPMEGGAVADFLNAMTQGDNGAPADGKIVSAENGAPKARGFQVTPTVQPGRGPDIRTDIVNIDKGTQEESHQITPIKRGRGAAAEAEKDPLALSIMDAARSQVSGRPDNIPTGPDEALSTRAKRIGAPNQTYVIKKGDNLTKIAKRFLGDGSRWREIAKANGMTVGNPNKIYTGKQLIIPGEGGGAPKPKARPTRVAEEDEVDIR